MELENILDQTFFVDSTRFNGRISCRRVVHRRNEAQPRAILVFASTAVLPADLLFGPRFDGYSWLDYMALQGYDCYSLDVRGYGNSSPCEELLAERPEHIRHFLTSADCAYDVLDVLRHALPRYRVRPEVIAIGYSWSCVTFLKLQEIDPGVTGQLVLVNPTWSNRQQSRPNVNLADIQRVLASGYSINRLESVWGRFSTGNVNGQYLGHPQWHMAIEKELEKIAGYDRVAKTWITPSGPFREVTNAMRARLPLTRLLAVTCTTHLLSCECDVENPAYMAQHIYNEIPARDKTFTIVPGGTHFMCWETSRNVLFDTVLRLIGRAAAQ